MDQKRFLFISWEGLITDIAWRVMKEGHEVRYYIREQKAKEIGDGFVPKTDKWKEHVDWADVVVFDDVLGQGEIAEELRRAGKKVVGGSAYTDKLEDSRSFGQEELKNVGIKIIPSQEFSSFDDAISFVNDNPGKYVIKPSGEAQNIKRLLFVGEEEDGKDIIRILEAYRKIWSKELKEFILQKRITGVEIAVGGFFNGSEFANPININFEHKKLFPGSIGPSTGEMGTSMFWCSPNKIFNETLKKLEPKLKAEHYVGYIDINCIVNSKGIYPLEFTSRFGYPSIFIQQETIITPLGEFLSGLADGTLTQFKTKNGFQVGVRIVVPPYPFDDEKTFETYSKDTVIIFKKPMAEGIHIEDVKMKNDQWVVTGKSGVALAIVGCGKTMKEAQAQAYARIKSILIPNMYYRTDIGDRWSEDADRLHDWGYLREN